jgi:bisphosphoglycerate-dependent phosphoglycerate mutase
LLGLILGRYGSENRFVKTTANQLDLAEAGELTQAIEEFRMALLEPFEEWTRVVQTEANGRMASDALNEREIGTLVGLFKHAIEITDGLMTMDQKNQMEFGQ